MTKKEKESESFTEQLERLHLIASGDRDCDMSENDLNALRALLMTYEYDCDQRNGLLVNAYNNGSRAALLDAWNRLRHPRDLYGSEDWKAGVRHGFEQAARELNWLLENAGNASPSVEIVERSQQ